MNQKKYQNWQSPDPILKITIKIDKIFESRSSIFNFAKNEKTVLFINPEMPILNLNSD